MVFLRLNVVKNAYFSILACFGGNFCLLKLPDFYTSILFSTVSYFRSLGLCKDTNISFMLYSIFRCSLEHNLHVFYKGHAANNLKQCGKRMTVFR